MWDTYENRLNAKGRSLFDTKLNRAEDYLRRKVKGSLSYHEITINGFKERVVIIDSDNLNEKSLFVSPNQHIEPGMTVRWMDNFWIITEKDANERLYVRMKMLQCNYLLKWIASDGNIIYRQCVIEDGTKYMAGETTSAYSQNAMSLGDTRISVTLPRDEYTVQLGRGVRFLIDDYDSPSVLAYRITKPFKIGGVYNGQGAMSFILTEVNTEDDDNIELHIADYYKYFPREGEAEVREEVEPGETVDEDTGKRVWL